jgi:Protein of unknown function (DUF3152)
MARMAIVGATVFASLTSSTIVVGLDPADVTNPVANPVDAVVAQGLSTVSPATTAGDATPEAAPETTDPCRAFLDDYCVEVPLRRPKHEEVVGSCAAGSSQALTGDIDVVPTAGDVPGGAYRIRIEIEHGLAIDGGCFAGEVLGILNDPRSWGATFAAVDGDTYDLRLVLASPETTNELCAPADTASIYSCRKGDRVVINLMRWVSGTDDYVGNITTYRQYLINHEVGHFLGRGHVPCPGAGQPAPVMMQQTKGLGECLPNGWPTESEHETRN